MYLYIYKNELYLLIFSFSYLNNLQVMIIRGKDKGETGVIKRVIRSQNRVIVEGKNLVSGPCLQSIIVCFIIF